MSRTHAATLVAAVVFVTFLAAQPAAAQVPFFGRGAGIFDPEIGVVQSGVLNDVQATVSAAKACRTELNAGAPAFKQKYGTFGHCVSFKAKIH